MNLGLCLGLIGEVVQEGGDPSEGGVSEGDEDECRGTGEALVLDSLWLDASAGSDAVAELLVVSDDLLPCAV